jgi:hypothetical protein
MKISSASTLLKAAFVCVLIAGDALGQALADNNPLSTGKEYNYTGGRYQGLTSDVVLNGLVEMPTAASATITGASSFLTRLTSFGTWKDMGASNGNNLPNGYVSASTATSIALPNLFLNEYNLQHGQKKDNYLAARFGPFWLTNVMGGVATIYNDTQGTFPSSNFNQQTDNWAAMTWVSATLTAYVTDRFAITMSPWVYYLPLEGTVGWAAGSGFVGLNSWISPQSMAQVGFHLPIGRWDISFHDQFQAYFLQDSILSENFFISAQASDIEPVDPAGRFQMGGFGPAYVDMTGETRLSSNGQMFRSDRMFLAPTQRLVPALRSQVTTVATTSGMTTWSTKVLGTQPALSLLRQKATSVPSPPIKAQAMTLGLLAIIGFLLVLPPVSIRSSPPTRMSATSGPSTVVPQLIKIAGSEPSVSVTRSVLILPIHSKLVVV